VDAATGGAGTAIYGPVLPGSWADDPALPKPARDTNAARKLIEGAGWTLGADGIYARNGVRLATSILVRGDRKERVKMADLVASQAGDCGMDLRSQPMSWDLISGTFFEYPHDIPGTKTSFDLYIGAWTTEADPGKDTVLASSAITDAKRPGGDNFSGFSDPVLDRLDAEAMATYDQASRTSLYRQEQEEIAAQLPYLFLWANNAYDVVRTAVTTAGGPLDLTAPYWDWQPERLVVEKSSP
jgi:peptide/nickel transport system substrate-binding protein